MRMAFYMTMGTTFLMLVGCFVVEDSEKGSSPQNPEVKKKYFGTWKGVDAKTNDYNGEYLHVAEDGDGYIFAYYYRRGDKFDIICAKGSMTITEKSSYLFVHSADRESSHIKELGKENPLVLKITLKGDVDLQIEGLEGSAATIKGTSLDKQTFEGIRCFRITK